MDVIKNPSVLPSLTLLQRSKLKSSHDVAKEAFDEAVAEFQQRFTADECKRIWVRDKVSMEDVLRVVSDGRTKYESKTGSEARKIISKLSSKIAFYGAVLDVLVQHHPEYVSLVWGTFKFVFQGVINQEELVQELSEALYEIGDALSSSEVYLRLYPADSMYHLVVTLYAQIIKFAIRAAKWYSKNKLQHALHAVFRPYPLRFKGLREEITTQTNRVAELALVMHMVEGRQGTIETAALKQKNMDLEQTILEQRAVMDRHHSMQMAALTLQLTAILDTRKRVCEVQTSQLLAFASSSKAGDPDLARLFYCSTRNIRYRRKQDSHAEFFRRSIELKNWGSEKKSSSVLISGHLNDRHVLNDFAANLIDLLVEDQIPTVWALQPKHVGQECVDYTSVEVLKQLVYQVLTKNGSLVDEYPASVIASKFQRARSESEWFNLLGSVLESLPQICFVIDLEAIGVRPASPSGQSVDWLQSFALLFDELRRRNVGTIIKVAFVGYSPNTLAGLSLVSSAVVKLPRKTQAKPKKQVGRKKPSKLVKVLKA